MDSALIAPVVSVISVIGTAIIGYLTMRRKNSGDAGTSDADRLWAANEDFRSAQTTDILRLKAEMLSLTATVDILRTEILQRDNRIFRLEQDKWELERKLAMLSTDNLLLKARVAELEGFRSSPPGPS